MTLQKSRYRHVCDVIMCRHVCDVIMCRHVCRCDSVQAGRFKDRHVCDTTMLHVCDVIVQKKV
jgi:hypothetical protein